MIISYGKTLFGYKEGILIAVVGGRCPVIKASGELVQDEDQRQPPGRRCAPGQQPVRLGGFDNGRKRCSSGVAPPAIH